MRIGTLAFCAWLLTAIAGAAAAEEFTSTAGAEPQSQTGLIVPPSAPKAAQIEPMVAPVKRSAPITPVIAGKSENSGKTAKPEKSAVKTSEKSASCGAGKKRASGDKCVKVAEDVGPVKKSAKKK